MKKRIHWVRFWNIKFEITQVHMTCHLNQSVTLQGTNRACLSIHQALLLSLSKAT